MAKIDNQVKELKDAFTNPKSESQLLKWYRIIEQARDNGKIEELYSGVFLPISIAPSLSVSDLIGYLLIAITILEEGVN